MIKIEVKVTAEHISKGKPGSPGSCPIALALREMGHKKVKVGLSAVKFDESPWYRLPSQASDFTWAFDGIETFPENVIHPFEFTIDKLYDPMYD